MPTQIPFKPYDPAAAASRLPESLQWLGGAAGSLLGDLTGANDPAAQLMAPSPMMAAETELTPLAKALFSRAQRAVAAMPDWLHPAKALSLLKNATSKEELDTRGLTQLLTERQGPGKISKAELQQHLANNPVPDVRVKTLQTGSGPSLPGETDEAYNARTRNIGPVQYNRPDLNVPGGKNYTESLFQLYPHNDPNLAEDMELLPQTTTKAHPELYNSSHWHNEPNVLAHTREDIRPDSQGRPGKFLQEIQSDWHQAGAKSGYKGDVKPLSDEESNRLGELVKKAGYLGGRHGLSEAERIEADALTRRHFPPSELVPDAPFKDTWPDLTLKKHVLDVANSPDQEWLGFTKGETQAERYNLARHIGLIDYEPKSGRISVTDTQGNVYDRVPEHLKPEELPQWFGQELTNDILHNPTTARTYEGTLVHQVKRDPNDPRLTLGGEGMHHFYDNVLPSRLNKILKPFGGSVEEGTVSAGPAPKASWHPNSGTIYLGEGQDPVATQWPLHQRTTFQEMLPTLDSISKRAVTPTAPAWMVTLTPEMKEAIKKAGLPLMALLLAKHLSSLGSQPPLAVSHAQPQQGQP